MYVCVYYLASVLPYARKSSRGKCECISVDVEYWSCFEAIGGCFKDHGVVGSTHFCQEVHAGHRLSGVKLRGVLVLSLVRNVMRVSW